MGTAVGTFSARTNHRIRLETQLASQNIGGNYSTVNWQLYAEKTSSSSSYYLTNGGGGSVNIGGNGISIGAWQYDFRSNTIYTLGSGSVTIGHNPDGTMPSYGLSASITAPGSLGSASASSADSLPTIPRATQPTVSPTSGNTGSTYTIGHTPASSAFYHDVAYSLDGGASYTNIATNVVGTTTSTSWTPAHSLLPDTTSDTAVIRVITRSSSGGTIIGTKTVNLPLTVPASVKPTISSVLFADSQTSSPDIPTLMGGAGRFVQGWSKLLPTVTAAGAGGSTVVSSAVTQAGQVTPSGTAFGLPVALSGAVPYSAIVTDSRGVVSDPYANTVAVAAYNFPNLPTPLVTRTSDSGGTTPSSTGTYLAITPGASVSSLIFGGSEKNLLEWRVRIKPVGGSFTTVQDWTASTVSGNTWTTKYVAAGPYASSTEWIVEVSIRDLFGKNGFNTGSTVNTLTVLVPSEHVTFDWDGDNGLGIGRYRQGSAMLDVEGQINQNAGRRVLDEDDLVPIASDLADVQSLAFTAARNRNRVINGDFCINQHGYVSGASLAVGAFGFDRWKAGSAGTTLTFTAAPQGQMVTINASHSIQQTIERANVEAGNYVLSWPGTAQARVYNSGATAPSYASSPVLVTLNGLADVVVEVGAGTVGEVQLERGSTPTPFERIPYSLELALCQRYFYPIASSELIVTNPYWNVNLGSGTQLFGMWHPVVMRRIPTLQNGSGGVTSLHQFNYFNYSAAAPGSYYLEMSATNERAIRGTYSSSNNGGNVLSIGRTGGQNINPIWLDAEF